MDKWTTRWEDLPNEMSFDELITHPLYNNFAEMGRTWQVLLKNGVFYTGTGETGQKCTPDAMLDKVFIR